MALWPLLLIVVILVGVIISGSREIEGLANLKSRERLGSDAASLQVNLSILYRNRTGCRANLTSSSFLGGLIPVGSGLAVNSGFDLTLFKPNGSGGTGPAFLAPNSAIGVLTAESVRFTSVRSVSSSGLGYLAELNISVRQSQNESLIRTPFYIITNAARTPVDCFASQYAQADPATGTLSTIEDRICEGTNGVGWYFDPVSYKCVN